MLKFCRTLRYVALTLTIGLISQSLHAIPITASSPYLFREGRLFQSGTAPPNFQFASDIIQFGARVVPIDETTGTFTNSVTSEVISGVGPDICGTDFLCSAVSFTSQRAAGSWTFDATNGPDTASITFGPLGEPVLPQFVTDVTVVANPDGSLDLSWTLPADTGDATQIRPRIHDDITGTRLFQDVLPLSATSAFVPAGILTDSGSYFARVMLDEGASSTRASTFEEFEFVAATVPVPEPSTAFLLALGLLGVVVRVQRMGPVRARDR